MAPILHKKLKDNKEKTKKIKSSGVTQKNVFRIVRKENLQEIKELMTATGKTMSKLDRLKYESGEKLSNYIDEEVFSKNRTKGKKGPNFIFVSKYKKAFKKNTTDIN